jgi:hypothetical protein
MRSPSLFLCVALSGSLIIGAYDCKASPTIALRRSPISSQSIERQIDMQRDQQVEHILTDGLKIGTNTTTVSIQRARIQLGQNYPPPRADIEDKTAGMRVKLDAVEVEGHAMPGIPEGNLQAQIPFGLAGVSWGLTHPGDAVRLVLPIQN